MHIFRDKRGSVLRAASVLCILLVFATGFIGAVHFHPKGTNTPDGACSTCALVHAGVIVVNSGPPVPVLVAAETVKESPQQLHSFAVVSSIYIRPPPLV